MDELQKSINRTLGVTDETWEKYSPEAREREKRIQAIALKIDEIETKLLMVMSMTTHTKSIQKMDEIQKSINAMMGLSDEVWMRYGPKN